MTTGQKELPAGWKWVKLGDVCNFNGVNSLTDNVSSSEIDRIYSLKVSGLTQDFCDGKYLIEGIDYTNRSLVNSKVIEPPAIVFPKRGGAIAKNRKVVTSIPSVLDPNLMAIDTHGKAEAYIEYLYWWLNSFDLSSIQTGTTVPQINRQDLAPLLIPLPPLEEQNRISAILNKAEEIKKLREEADKKTEELIPAIFHEMFGDTTQFGICQLDEIASIKMGNSPKGDTYNSNGVGTPLINGPTEFGSYNPTPVQWTTEPTRICEKGDILLCVRGNTTGRMNWADQGYCIGRGLAAVTTATTTIKNEYIYEVLNSTMPNLLARLSSGSVFPNISKGYLSEFMVPVPPISLQDRFVERIKEAHRIDAQQKKSKSSIGVLSVSLLQMAFRGEL